LTAWAQATPLPHALDACLGLLSVKLLDVSSLTSPVPRPSGLALRLTYAAALTRLVNGLVDPLQVGAYARSIAQLAAQLGLPAWLVELRHAATHEELPGLEVLREGVRQVCATLSFSNDEEG
jgi:ribosomal biogenesis protein LAS1